MAVAGFMDGDVEVWSEGRVLHIKGSNRENAVAPRFTCSFYHKIPCSKYLDLDRAEANLLNGILSIKIPVEEERVEQRRYLLKKSERE
jgi:HSP20 family molecular chaperone IbpA